MPTIKLKLEVRDKNHNFILKTKYDPDTHFAIAGAGFRKKFPTKYIVLPEDIVRVISRNGRKVELKADVSAATRHSIHIAQRPDWAISTPEKSSESQGGVPHPLWKKKDDSKPKEQGKADSEPVNVDPANPEFETDFHDAWDILQKLKNMLDYFTERTYWDSLIKKGKLALSTILIMLAAGGGLFYLIRDVLLPIFGVQT